MSTTTTRKPRSSKKSAVVPTPAAAAAPAAAAEAPRPSLARQLNLAELFLPDGTFTQRDVFKYNTVFGGALVMRRAVFGAIALATKEQIMALPIEARKTIFRLIKGETSRYLGQATRKLDSAQGKAGEPLPKLSFPTPVEAVSYRAQMQRAMDNMRLAVFGTLEDTRGAQA